MWDDALNVYLFGILVGLLVAALVVFFGKRIKDPSPDIDIKSAGEAAGSNDPAEGD